MLVAVSTTCATIPFHAADLHFRGSHLAGDTIEGLVEEKDEGKGDVLVEGVLDEALQAVVCQVAVHQQQPSQKSAEQQAHAQYSMVDFILVWTKLHKAEHGFCAWHKYQITPNTKL